MFSLRIQSVDFPAAADGSSSRVTTTHALSPRSSHPLPSTTSASATTPLELPGATSAASCRNPSIHHTRGILHLYRTSSSPASAVAAATSSSGPTAPQLDSDSLLPVTTLPRFLPILLVFARAHASFPVSRGHGAAHASWLLVLAVPTRVSPDDFVRFCGPYIDHASDIRVIRGDGVEDRYSVLVEFEDQKSADGLYLDLNGWRFSSSEVEVCHVLFIVAVQYTPDNEIAVTPPVESTELPTCPVCIERLDPDISGIVATTCDHSFQCSCVSMWVNSSCPVCQFGQKQSENPTCSVCQTSGFV